MKKVICTISLLVLSLLSSFVFAQEKNIGKLKANINYEEFIPEDQISFGPVNVLNGLWSGTYKLEKKSIYWINPKFNTDDVLRNIKLGPYTIHLKFTVSQLGRLLGIDIVQKEIQYESNGFKVQNDNQFNYWTTAKVDNWIQVIRGKVYRINQDELLTVFQTIVYEEKIPIYAFEGIAILKKA